MSTIKIAALTLAAAACATFAGCSSGGGDSNGAQPGPGTTQAAKGDCPDCNPAGPGALLQAGIADRFFAPGDQWKVAYQFRQRAEMSRELVLAVDEEELAVGGGVQAARAVSELFLFDYATLGVDRRVFSLESGQKVQREVAEIAITPGDPAATEHPELFSTQEIGRFEHKLAFELNDLLEPVSETIYDRQHPNGRRIAIDSKSRLQTGSSLFPHTIPRALVQPGFQPGGAIEMSAEVEAAADAFVPGWRERVYRKYTFEDIGETAGSGDVVYWAEGDLWPFYVRTDQGEGVLIRFDAGN